MLAQARLLGAAPDVVGNSLPSSWSDAPAKTQDHELEQSYPALPMPKALMQSPRSFRQQCHRGCSRRLLAEGLEKRVAAWQTLSPPQAGSDQKEARRMTVAQLGYVVAPRSLAADHNQMPERMVCPPLLVVPCAEHFLLCYTRAVAGVDQRGAAGVDQRAHRGRRPGREDG